MAKLNKSASDFKLGILLVHGIGSQTSGETLVQWGDALLKIIGRATRRNVKAVAHHAIKDDTGAAEMIAHIEADGANEKWLISEGRWADSFLPPSYADLVSWSMRAIPWTLSLHIAQRYWRRCENRGWMMKIYAAIIAVGELLLTLTVAPLSMLLLLISLLLGMLPVPQLRSLILLAQGTLVSSVGDSLAFVESPTRAALIRTRLLERLHSLNGRCEKTIVIAHSQGAAVVLDALGGIPEPLFSGQAPYFNDLPEGLEMPDTLITFGAGTNQLASLKVLASGPFMKAGLNPATYALIAFLSGLVITLYLRLTGAPYVQIIYAGACILPGLILLLLWKYPVKMLRKRYKKIKLGEKNTDSLALYTFIPTGPVIYLLLMITTDITQLPALSILLFLLSIGILAASIIAILSLKIKSEISISRKPPGLATWIDMYASADPVSNGPTNIAHQSEQPRFSRVWNFGAMLYDHTAYWQNPDGFVLQIARACAATAGSRWATHLPNNQDLIDNRSEFRTFWLRISGRIVILAWLIIGFFVWTDHRASIPVLFSMPEWLKFNSDNFVRFTVLIAMIVSLIWLSYNIIRVLWLFWVRKEQKILLNHGTPGKNSELLPFTAMIMVVGTVFIVGFILITKTTDEILQIRMSIENLLEFLGLLFVYSVCMHFLCLRIKKVPVEKLNKYL